MKDYKLVLYILFATGIIAGCTNESSSDLVANPGLNDITYLSNIKSIIDNNCTSCHATAPINGAPMPLTTFNEVKDAVLNRGLIDRISRPQGESGLMPTGARLPQTTIDIILQWQQEGLQN